MEVGMKNYMEAKPCNIQQNKTIVYFWVHITNFDNFNENRPPDSYVWMFVSSCWNCLWRIRRFDLIGGGVLVGVSFEVSETHTIQSAVSAVWLLRQHMCSQLLFQGHACMSAAMLFTMMVKESPSEIASRPNSLSL